MLDAHHIFLELKYFFKLLLISLISLSDSENLRLPKNLTFLTPSFFKYFCDSLLEDKQRLNLSKRFFEKLEKNFHFLKVLLVILPFKRFIDIFFLFKFKNILGQISESIKNTIEGFQYSKNLFE